MSARQRRNRRRRNARRTRRQQVDLRAPIAQSQQIVNRGALRQLTITHREFIRDLSVTSGLSPVVVQFEINPGLDEAFPWLSAIATRFESYSFNSLAFNYVPAVGTTTSGALALVPDYDAADDNSDAPKSKLLTYEDSVRGPLWAPLTCRCTRSNLSKMKQRYVRNGDLTSNLDIKMYDVLSLTLCTSFDENAPPGNYGELWVDYSITFYTPQLEPEPPETTYRKFGPGVGENPFGFPAEPIVDKLPIRVFDPDNIDIYEPGDYLMTLISDVGENNTFLDIDPHAFTGPPGSWVGTLGEATDWNTEAGSSIFQHLVHCPKTTDDDNPVRFNWTGATVGILEPPGSPQMSSWLQLARTGLGLLVPLSRRKYLGSKPTVITVAKPVEKEKLDEESVMLPMTMVRDLVSRAKPSSEAQK